MTQAEAISILPTPKTILAYHYTGGNSLQRRKEQRAYVRDIALLFKLSK